VVFEDLYWMQASLNRGLGVITEDFLGAM